MGDRNHIEKGEKREMIPEGIDARCAAEGIEKGRKRVLRRGRKKEIAWSYVKRIPNFLFMQQVRKKKKKYGHP